jgi:predicted nucleic acid-binding protein
MDRERLLVADAGPFITLAAIGRVELLRELAPEVVVPRAVFDEILAGAPRPGAQEIRAKWIRVADASRGLSDAFGLLVDRGEAEALALATDLPGSLLVVDDLRARRLAHEVGLRFTGTLGIFAMAKKAGLLTTVRAEIEHLRRVGFRIADALATEFLRRVDESDDG